MEVQMGSERVGGQRDFLLAKTLHETLGSMGYIYIILISIHIHFDLYIKWFIYIYFDWLYITWFLHTHWFIYIFYWFIYLYWIYWFIYLYIDLYFYLHDCGWFLYDKLVGKYYTSLMDPMGNSPPPLKLALGLKGKDRFWRTIFRVFSVSFREGMFLCFFFLGESESVRGGS